MSEKKRNKKIFLVVPVFSFFPWSWTVSRELIFLFPVPLPHFFHVIFFFFFTTKTCIPFRYRSDGRWWDIYSMESRNYVNMYNVSSMLLYIVVASGSREFLKVLGYFLYHTHRMWKIHRLVLKINKKGVQYVIGNHVFLLEKYVKMWASFVMAIFLIIFI